MSAMIDELGSALVDAGQLSFLTPLVWEEETLTQMLARDGHIYHALHLSGEGVAVYQVKGQAPLLTRLELYGQSYLWLMVWPGGQQNAEGLLWRARQMLRGRRTQIGLSKPINVVLPMFDALGRDPYHDSVHRVATFTQAQKAAACGGSSCHLELNSPFIGAVTDRGPLTIKSVFYADYPSLRKV